jgi:hypothetical protein
MAAPHVNHFLILYGKAGEPPGKYIWPFQLKISPF